MDHDDMLMGVREPERTRDAEPRTIAHAEAAAKVPRLQRPERLPIEPARAYFGIWLLGEQPLIVSTVPAAKPAQVPGQTRIFVGIAGES